MKDMRKKEKEIVQETPTVEETNLETKVDLTEPAVIQDEAFDYAKEHAAIEAALAAAPSSVIDSIEKDNFVEVEDDKGPAFPDPEENFDNVTQTLHSKDFYDKQAGMQPAIEVTTKKSGFSGEDTAEQFNKQTRKKQTRGATEFDLENLDESKIMDMPHIKAASFEIIDILNPRPKDKGIRFKWANRVNSTAGNLGRYLTIGFKMASIDDIDQTKTPIDASMIEGTQVKYHDVVLLKIDVMRLMELYKSNILRSIMKLGRVREKGMAEAQRQFKSDLSGVPGAAKYFNEFKEARGRDPVEFFTPGMEESNVAGR